MAKTQTFGDKLKKKKGSEKPTVKIIKGIKGDDGTTHFMETFIKVDDVSTIEKVKI
ncbi:MAG: hypothetical protein ABFD61_00635 [Chloroherpetonaceae bacterium]|jgi:hypothetical protein|nr:hypothetical protein [bacterium]